MYGPVDAKPVDQNEWSIELSSSKSFLAQLEQFLAQWQISSLQEIPQAVQWHSVRSTYLTGVGDGHDWSLVAPAAEEEPSPA